MGKRKRKHKKRKKNVVNQTTKNYFFYSKKDNYKSWIGIFIGIIGIIVGLLTVFPKVSIQPPMATDVSDPFKIPFVIENNSLFSIKNIKVKARYLYVFDDKNQMMKNVTIDNIIRDADILKSNKQTSIKINPAPAFNFLSPPYMGGKIELVINYDYFLNREEEYFFVLQKGSSGEHIWVPTNAIKNDVKN